MGDQVWLEELVHSMAKRLVRVLYAASDEDPDQGELDLEEVLAGETTRHEADEMMGWCRDLLGSITDAGWTVIPPYVERSTTYGAQHGGVIVYRSPKLERVRLWLAGAPSAELVVRDEYVTEWTPERTYPEPLGRIAFPGLRLAGRLPGGGWAAYDNSGELPRGQQSSPWDEEPSRWCKASVRGPGGRTGELGKGRIWVCSEEAGSEHGWHEAVDPDGFVCAAWPNRGEVASGE